MIKQRAKLTSGRDTVRMAAGTRRMSAQPVISVGGLNDSAFGIEMHLKAVLKRQNTFAKSL